MRPAAAVVIAASLFVAGFAAGVAWQSSRAPEEHPVVEREPPSTPRQPLKPREVPAPAPEVSREPESKSALWPQEIVRREPTIADRVAELRRLGAAEHPDANEIRRRLEALVALGTPDAIGAALELMEDAAFDFSGRADTFAELLAKVDDPRIDPAAKRVLERNLENGSDSWVTTFGYLRLASRQGDAAAAQLLLDLITKRPSGQVANFAAESISGLQDHSLAPSFLDLVRTGHDDSVAIVQGLAAWRDPAILAELQKLALREDQPIQRIDLVGNALGLNLDSTAFAECLARYGETSDPRERELLLHVLYEASKNDRLDVHAIVPQATTVLLDALRPTTGLWQPAMWAVRENEVFRTPEILAVVQTLADSHADEDVRLEARRLLAQIRSR